MCLFCHHLNCFKDDLLKWADLSAGRCKAVVYLLTQLSKKERLSPKYYLKFMPRSRIDALDYR